MSEYLILTELCSGKMFFLSLLLEKGSPRGLPVNFSYLRFSIIQHVCKAILPETASHPAWITSWGRVESQTKRMRHAHHTFSRVSLRDFSLKKSSAGAFVVLRVKGLRQKR